MPSVPGVVDAAREKGIIAFGNVNDMNKEENGTDVVVTSALWDMTAAIAHAISRVKDAASPPGTTRNGP